MARNKKKNESLNYNWSKYQLDIFDYIEHGQGHLVVEAAAGSGKCLGKGTEVIMFDGTIKKVENIVVGDVLMGDDSTPRNVLATTIGKGELCKIIPNKSEPWVCNNVHILTVDHYRQIQENKIRKAHHEIFDISIDVLESEMKVGGYKISKHKNGTYRQIKLIKPRTINFPNKKLFIHPYLYGVWLGDGTSSQASITTVDEEIINGIKEVLPKNYFATIHNYASQGKISTIRIHSKNKYHNHIRRFFKNSTNENGKFIYHDYLTSSLNERLELLGGLIDTDGYYNKSGCYEIVTKYDLLAKNILFLCRSIGLSAYDSYREKKCYNNGVIKKYHCIYISGEIDKIPVRLKRKKASKRNICKNNLHEGFRIEHIGSGDFYGFTLDGNGRFLLGDFTITHNTSTLVKSLELIPETKKVLLTAFNNDIVKELEKKTKEFKNVDTKTLHGLGLAFLKKNFPEKKLVLTPFKYDSYLQENISDLTSINTYRLGGKYFKYLDNIKKYINYGRFYLCETVKDLDFIQDRYDIETIADEKEIALEALRWGKEELDYIDYGDMIWMPNVLYLKPLGLLYDFIMVDECQDMNKAERELILKCFKMGTRLVSVGDSQQMLYSFAGGDPQSFNALKSIPNTVCLPLSISYRCASKIVDFAKKIVPTIEPNDDGRVGEILYDVPLDAVCDGDMVLCRNNAPLVQAYNTFLKLGKKAFIRGKDIGANLKVIVRSTRQDKLNADLKNDGVFVRLYDDLFVSRNKIMDKFGIDEETAIKSQQIQSKLDSIKALEILSEGLSTTEEIMAKIDEIFPAKDKKDGIALSTVHKAKGLEANNVYIVCNSLMPSKSAKKDWEIKQEYNLMYVAYTRAKNKLGFIDEKDFEEFDFSNSNNIKILKRIETQVNQVLNKSTKIVLNEANVKTIIKNAQKINKDILTSTTVNMNSMGKRKVNAFSDLLKNKKAKKIKL